MARSRNIKPSFFSNDVLASLNPLARILFAGLWTIADREGRLEDRPARIKVDCLPYDECDVSALLDALAAGPDPFIVRYEVEGRRYIQILTWHKHQSPHVREPGSDIPSMPDEPVPSTSLVPAEPVGSRLRESGIRNQESEEGGCKGETPEPPVDTASTPCRRTPSTEPFDVWWASAPKRVGRGDAVNAYAKAVKAIRGREGPGGDDPHGFLLDRITAFAATPKANGEFCPYPAKWLDAARYDDDPVTWQDGGNGAPKAAVLGDTSAERERVAGAALAKRTAEAMDVEAERNRLAILDLKHGPQLDSLDRAQIRSLATKRLGEASTALLCKSIPKLPLPLGVLRTELLEYLAHPEPAQL